MKNKSINQILIFTCIVVGMLTMGFNCPPQKKPAETGEFLTFGGDPSIVCVNQGIPIVRVTFTASSSSNQCVRIFVNGINIVGAFESPIESIIGQNRCGSGEWGETYGFSLSELFGTNIPPSITITGELISDNEVTTATTVFDSASTSVTTRICGPPDLIGN